MKRTIIMMALIILGASVGASPSCSQGGSSGMVQTVNFGSNPSGSAALIYIAQDRGIFANEGLKVNIKDFSTGAAAIDTVLKGEMDIAWSSEFPLVRRAFTKDSISAIAVINRFTDQYIFCGRDGG